TLYIEAIIRNLYEPKISEVQLQFIVGSLLTELMNHPESINAYSRNSYEKTIMNTVLKYVVKDYKEGSLQVLSKKLHLPDYKVCKIIKAITGKTFKELVQGERLKIASELLESTSIPILDIMIEVGYENITYFYKIFKIRFNCTPKEYRSKMQNRLNKTTKQDINIIP
ncbi:MAG: helix-turn-helix domain-containing protein, partial [Coprobacillaceae bacterium]